MRIFANNLADMYFNGEGVATNYTLAKNGLIIFAQKECGRGNVYVRK